MPAIYECDSHMTQFLTELPKCEHHVHLEGTLSPSLLFKLISKHNVELPSDFPSTPEALEIRYNQFTDLDDFLHFYYIGMNVLKDEDDFFQLAWEYFQTAATQGLHHAETFFDPQGHLCRGIEFETFLNGFTRAAAKAKQELGITSKLIMCLLRHLPVPDCLETIDLAHKHYESGAIHGLGLDSSEKPFPPHLFAECYGKIKDKFPHVGLTAHAGEEGGPEFVTNSLDLLNVTRIDHGVNSVKDQELMKRLAANRTMLSVCPMSNLKLRVVSDLSQLPLKELLDAGVPFSINSDDPAYFNSYILENYVQVHKHFGFDLKTWCRISKFGIEGSWIEDDHKKQLLQKVDDVYKKFLYIEN
ncbi:adenine deaminase [Saccharomycopsis crataegensis]|uniref:Adenine deaminase n=1 Tax=Saccharomycopsis crataegensis TaxID=43959 RepID=A0AAV5QT20_9ASCO|nr:adenine deaminase [Saccharomycopsis crataegensis]